jgi:hypothetical protein
MTTMVSKHHSEAGKKGIAVRRLERRPQGGFRHRTPPPLPPPQVQWATMSTRHDGVHICLWGRRVDAEENCDPDERVCRVRVDVLEIL